MFHDYIPLMLVNMTGGLVVLALYFIRGAGKEDQRAWCPALAAPGLVALVTGLHMALTWPLPKLAHVNLAWANGAYGDTSVLLGVLFLAGALALGKGWSLGPVGYYAVVASLAAGVIGVRIYTLGLSNAPAMTAGGFLVTAAAGVASAFAFCPCAGGRIARAAAAVLLLAAAGVWGLTAAMAYWGHLAMFSKI